MKKIRVTISKIKNHFYAKIPYIVATNLNLSDSDNIEISIHKDEKVNKIEI